MLKVLFRPPFLPKGLEMNRRTGLRFITLMWLFLLAHISFSHAQESAFRLQNIPISGLPAYDLKVAPQRALAVVYTGRTSMLLLGVPLFEYVVDTSVTALRLIDLNTGEELTRLQGAQDYVADVAISPAEDQIAALFMNGELFVWSLEDYTLVQRFNAAKGGAMLAYLPEGQSLIMLPSQQANEFMVWDLASAQMRPIWRPPLSNFGQVKLGDAMTRLDFMYNAFALSAQGIIATITPNGELALWDNAMLEQRILRPRDEDLARFNVRQLSFSLDGKTLVYYDRLSQASHLWDADSATEIERLPVGGVSVVLSPDGAWLAWTDRESIRFAQRSQAQDIQEIPLAQDTELDFNPNAPIYFLADGRLVVGGFWGSLDNQLWVISPNP